MSSTERPPIVELRGVSKQFGGIRALRGVDLKIHAGTVIGIAGENGAGKSTLLKILTGIYQPSQGQILYHGELQKALSPRRAAAAGVAYVAQELSVFEHLSVLDNIILGHEPMRAGIVDRRAGRKLAADALARVGSDISVDAMVRDLAFADRQLVEIAKALVSDPKLLVLDEPTSGLREEEVRHLLGLMSSLRDQGRSVIFITHRMSEFFAVTDQMFVMRDGQSVRTLDTRDTNPDEVVSLMIGGRLNSMFPERPPVPSHADAEPLLTTHHLSVDGTSIAEINLELRCGEILGIAGLAGNGQNELLEGLGGVRRCHGEYLVNGISGPFRSVRAAMNAGIALVPEDRKRHGLVLPLSIAGNMMLPHLQRFSRHGVVRDGDAEREVREMVETMQVRPPNPSSVAESLSGGNQQKVVIGKALMATPRVYLFSDPTRGIDVKTKFEIYTLMRDIAARGDGVILVSTDLAEVTNLCHRVLVMAHGRVVAELTGEQINDHDITKASFEAVTA